jgi:chaperonin GroEL
MQVKSNQTLVNEVFLLEKLVKPTLGHSSRSVLLERMSGLLPTQDGFTIVQESQVSSLILSPLRKINRDQGNGTTTSVLLLAELIRRLSKIQPLYKNHFEFVSDCQRVLAKVQTTLKELSFSVEDITPVIEVAYKEDTLEVDLLKEVCELGNYANVLFKSGQHIDSKIRYQEGYTLPFRPPTFHLKDLPTLQGVIVTVINRDLRTHTDVVPILETLSQFPQNPSLIVCKSLSGSALDTFLYNKSKLLVGDEKKPFDIWAIEAPGRFDQKINWLEDLSVYTGASLYHGLQEFDNTFLGTIKEVSLEGEELVLTPYEEHLEKVEFDHHLAKLENFRGSPFEEDTARERLAKLTDSFCVFDVGGATESEIREKKSRLEDVMHTITSSLAGGVVYGGGISFLKASASLDSSCAMEKAWIEVLSYPFKSLCENQHLNSFQVQREIQNLPYGYGYNIKTRSIEKLDTVIEPVETWVSILDTVVNTAMLILNSEVLSK